MAESSNFLRIEMDHEGRVVEFTPDVERCEMAGLVAFDRPEERVLFIAINSSRARLVSSEDPVEDLVDEEAFYGDQGCRLTNTGLPFIARDWRRLEGESFQIDYEAEAVHPILPDNPANLYFAAQHHVPNHNHIVIGTRTGCFFDLDWRFVAEGYAEEKGTRISVGMAIPFRCVKVYFRERRPVNIQAAQRLARQFAQESDLGEPTIEAGNCVRFPIRDAAE
jgi:hypothetical protein